jgi:hypothetical protein
MRQQRLQLSYISTHCFTTTYYAPGTSKCQTLLIFYHIFCSACLQPLLQRTNALLGSWEPWQIVLLAIGATLLAVAALQVHDLDFSTCKQLHDTAISTRNSSCACITHPSRGRRSSARMGK